MILTRLCELTMHLVSERRSLDPWTEHDVGRRKTARRRPGSYGKDTCGLRIQISVTDKNALATHTEIIDKAGQSRKRADNDVV